MIDETRVQQLLEEMLESGRSPDEVCADAPELLATVRERWASVRALDAEVEALFPAPPRSGAGRSRTEPLELPQIHGYVVEAEIGRGGVGVVYKARHLRLGRTVALKMLLAGEYAMPEQLARFAREAEVVASLRHPNIVQVFDVGDHERRPYFTMEFLEGGSLAQKLAGTPQPARDAAALVATLAEAVEVAHTGGVVHRDLKPANILLDRHGTPKISDFGLARRLESGGDLTLSGAAVGTPSYMSPEQALGREREIGPATDIYSLGAMLYEALTGRPPFRAETAAETERQVVDGELVRPSRLNAKVPRDLETICSKCLRKEPARRFASAGELAADLRRFLRGEPVLARRIGVFERFVKWVARRPALAAAITGATLLAFAVAGGGLWLALERANAERAVEEDLRIAAHAERASRWVEARTAVERAKARISDRDLAELRERADQVERDLDLVARLDAIHLERAAVVEGLFDVEANRARADLDYEAAFAASGICTFGEDASLVATRVVGSDLHAALLAALDDWASCCSRHGVDDVRLAWVLDVAQRSDVVADAWRTRARDLATWRDRDALAALARTAPTSIEDPSNTSLPCVMALAERLPAVGISAAPLLENVQREHPGYFWANFALGDALRAARPVEAIRYYQAALSLRPDAAVVRNNFGHALALDGRFEEALDQFRKALRDDPSFGVARSNLGNTLDLAGRDEEAIEAYERAIELDPALARNHANLAKVLTDVGRFDDALQEAERAVALEPAYAIAHLNRGFVLRRMQRIDEAIESYRKAIDLDATLLLAHVDLGFAYLTKAMLPEATAEFERTLELDANVALAHCGLSTVMRKLGRIDQAIEHGEAAVRIDPKLSSSHNDLGIALAEAGRIDDAIERLRVASSLSPNNVETRNNLGNVYGLNGQFDEAIEQFREALRLAPDSAQANGALGQALLNSGQLSEATDALRRALALFPDRSPQHAECAQQLRACERMLELEARLPAVIEGRDAPRGGAECMDFARLCRLQRRFALAARFCEQAFVAEPVLAASVQSGARYDAACFAALAGSSRDIGAADVEDAARAHWREQARVWLRADLESCDPIVDASEPGRRWVREFVSHWLADPDLAGLRDEEELAELPEPERQECRELWDEARALLTRARQAR